MLMSQGMEPDTSPSFPSWAWIVIFVIIVCMTIFFRVLSLYCRRRGLNNDRLSPRGGHVNVDDVTVTSATYSETELTGGRTPAMSVVSLNFPPRNIDGAVRMDAPPPYSFCYVQNDTRGANLHTREKPPSYSELDLKVSLHD